MTDSFKERQERREAVRRAEDYDASAFELDLDTAIQEARDLVGVGAEPRLRFVVGDSIESAMQSVCTVLMLRELHADTLRGGMDGVWLRAREMLIAKNKAYGDSALNPVRIFATSSPMEQLLVRLDDKISRIERGQAAGEDVAADMLGYFLLVLIARRREKLSPQ